MLISHSHWAKLRICRLWHGIEKHEAWTWETCCSIINRKRSSELMQISNVYLLTSFEIIYHLMLWDFVSELTWNLPRVFSGKQPGVRWWSCSLPSLSTCTDESPGIYSGFAMCNGGILTETTHDMITIVSKGVCAHTFHICGVFFL